MTSGPSTRRLTREKILDAVTDLLESSGAEAVTTKTIGQALHVHPTALYRHFRDMDELLREAADAILVGLGNPKARSESVSVDHLTEAADICRRLRSVLMAHPRAAQVMSSGPSRMVNERALTEEMLRLLDAAGLSHNDQPHAYHALIEFTVGTAAIDSMNPTDDAHEETRHRMWRAEYLTAAPDKYPHTVRMAATLYPGVAEQFEFGLGLLVDGLRLRAKGQPNDAPETKPSAAH